jgi:hypothetical protein
MIRNVYRWYKNVYTLTSLYIHVYTMCRQRRLYGVGYCWALFGGRGELNCIQTRKCIDMFMACLSPSMLQTLYRHVHTLYIHVYVIWSGFQMMLVDIQVLSSENPARPGLRLSGCRSRYAIWDPVYLNQTVCTGTSVYIPISVPPEAF